MQRILVIGSPGSGKSTVSRQLSQKLNIPIVHLDQLFWQDNWTQRSKEEFDKLLLQALTGDKWIMDGNYSRTFHERMKYADTVIMFDYPTYICFWRIIKRIVLNYGRTRPDMGDNCPERFDREFLKYVLDFRKTQRSKMLEMLTAYPTVNKIIVKNRREFADFEAKYLK